MMIVLKKFIAKLNLDLDRIVCAENQLLGVLLKPKLASKVLLNLPNFCEVSSVSSAFEEHFGARNEPQQAISNRIYKERSKMLF